MCGIIGVMGSCSDGILNAMLQKIAHRGPDNLSSFSSGDVHLAHARLSIIDLSSNSNQPLWDKTRQVCIVFNGEIYNYRELRDNLIKLGYEFLSEGDAEVILNLYLEYGEYFLEQLSGIYAFSIWDTRSKIFFIARDPYGVKPLYYSENNEGFYFASELKALLVHPNVSRELNVDALFRTVVFLWSPGPETVLKNIFKLQPGHYLVVKNKKIVKQKSYYTWPEYEPRGLSVNAICDKIQESLRESVREQLVSDVPIGAFLGGLDSSLIVAIVKDLGVKRLPCFTTFSSTSDAGFESDLLYAKRVAQHFNYDHKTIKLTPNVCKLINKMIYHLDEPQADIAPINTLLICEEARKQGIKVLFSGAAGDDIFTGYRRHLAVRLQQFLRFIPVWMLKSALAIMNNLSKKRPFLRRLTKWLNYFELSENERILSYFYWIEPEMVRNLFTDKIQRELSLNPMMSMLNELEIRSGNPLEKMLYLEQRYFLVDHNLNYTDKMAMAHGVEVRVPFLDKRLIEIASQIKSSLKQHYHVGKWILKKMAERYLPKSVIYRSKSGFGAPLGDWLDGDLKPIIDEILSENSLKKRGLFKFDEVQNLLENDRTGKAYYTYPIFALVCIELWCRIFLDQNDELQTSESMLEKLVV